VTAIHIFDRSGPRRTFAAGQAVFAEGDDGDVMYAVVEGEVDLVVSGRIVETAGPGGIIGEMALIDNGPRSATARARTDSVLVLVGPDQFLFLVQEHPTFALSVMRIMASRLRQMDRA
jgi:CRP/FNR family transcriptional regulator, cyclic AMP receptor protein